MGAFSIALLIVLLHYISKPSNALQPVTCSRTYRKVGCYLDNTKPLDILMLNDRDTNSPVHDGHLLDWSQWHASLHSLACRCAKKATQQRYRVFGMQNFGECWSGTGNYTRDGVSHKCYMELKTPPPPCDRNDPRECMGGAGVNYVYELVQAADQCQPDPCQNGGTCSRTNSAFQCACPPSHTGKVCDQDVNECLLSNTCRNGGTCVNQQGGYLCQCRPGFSGSNCEIDDDECRTKPCANGGTCVNTPGSYTCTCPQGFTGRHCDTVCRSPVVDLGIVLDGSGSVGNDHYMSTKLVLVRLVNSLGVSPSGTHVGLIYYSDKPHLFFKLNNRPLYKPIGLKLKFLGLPFPDGETRTDLALKLAGEKLFTATNGDRPRVPNVLLVITDGKTGHDSQPYKEVLKPLAARGVRIIVVGVGHSVNQVELLEIAMGQQNNVFHVPNIENLNLRLISKVIKSSCPTP